MTTEPAEVYAIFFGNVQGVGFRYRARREASRLGLTGRAVNLPDGTVEVIAQGPKEKLEIFIKQLIRLEPPIWVEKVETTWRTLQEVRTGFEIH